MTIVNRRTYIPKRGHVDEAITMLKAEETDLVKRVYRSYYGQFDVVVMEIEFASVAEMETRWAEWFQTDYAKTFVPRWEEITEHGGTNEVWVLE